MKACVKCHSDLPESAVHCVYCGHKQPGSAPKAAGHGPTMHGHPGMTADLLRQAEAARAIGSIPAPAQRRTPEWEHEDRKNHVGPHPGPRPPRPAHQQATIAADLAPIVGGPPPAMPPPAAAATAPPHLREEPATVSGRPSKVPGHARNVAFAATESSPAVLDGREDGLSARNMAFAATEPTAALRDQAGAPSPLPPPAAPVHAGAWQIQGHRAVAAHAHAPGVAKSLGPRLRVWLLVSGVLLAASFAAPWSLTAGGATFSWTHLTSAPLASKLPALLLIGSAVLALVFGLTPLSVRGRGWAAGLLGLVCVHAVATVDLATAAASTGAIDPLPSISTATAVIATATLVPGLLVRAVQPAAWRPRILALLGLAAAIATVAIDPVRRTGAVATVQELLAGQVSPAAVTATALWGVTAASLVVWLPARSRLAAGLARAVAWLLIAAPVARALAHALPALSLDVVRSDLATLVYLPVAAALWTALAGYGLAAAAGRGIEAS